MKFRRIPAFLPPAALMLVAVCANSVADNAADTATGDDYFEQHIRPVLVNSCGTCHSAEQGDVEGEFALDNRASLLRGGKSGAAIVPGKPEESRLLKAIRYNDAALKMPPDEELPDDVVAHFEQWIAMGAPDPRDGTAVEIDTIAARAAKHWAYQVPQRVEPPRDKSGWSRRPLDRVVISELQQAGLRPVEQADRHTLIRRLYFDLIGLPPTYEQVEAFAKDGRPDAYEETVDRLLASPQFGERWARHWLDVARFADSKGYVFKEERDIPRAFKYRDWVIGALNDDLPINKFLEKQIYATPETTDATKEADLAALGYLTLGRRFLNRKEDIIADRIDVVTRGMLGVTVGCARCHDHKYDPFSIQDYYALYGVFQSSDESQPAELPPILADRVKPINSKVFLRGNSRNRGDIVPRGVPVFFASDRGGVRSGSGRRELAAMIVDNGNPLTARVFVNRVWGHLFGNPLVSTSSDFGLRCPPPRQQELLDFLAVEFVQHDWSLKWLVREIVVSSTYRLSSQASDALLAADAGNKLLGRADRRRRDFESLRDTLLSVAGRLDTSQIGGPSERIDTGDGGSRRTLYAYIDRQNLPAVFRTFDFASPDAHCPQRQQTMVPQQALFLLNSDFVQHLAEAVAAKLPDGTPTDRVDRLYRAVLQRNPTAKERKLAIQFVEGYSAATDSSGRAGSPPLDVWSQLVQVLFASNEFAYID